MDEREFARWLDKHRDKGDFSYVKFPSVLFRSPMYRCLSAEAILIYALMRDRLSLSEKNKMQDEKKRTYIIFSRETIMEVTGCGRTKASHIFKELVDVNLIFVVRRGQGNPPHIYVYDLLAREHSADEPDETANTTTDKRPSESHLPENSQTTGKRSSEKRSSEEEPENSQRTRKRSSRGPENGLLEDQKTVTNHTEYNQTYNNHINNIKEESLNKKQLVNDIDDSGLSSSAENNKLKEDYGDVSDIESVKDYENQTYDDHPLPPPAPLDSATRAYFKRTKNELPPPEYFDQFKASPSEPSREESDAEKEERFRSSETYQYLLRAKAEREAAMAAPPTETKSSMQIAHEKQIADQAELEAALAECDWYPEDDE